MKNYVTILLLVTLIPVIAVAEKKKKSDVPEAFSTAHSIYVESADGDYAKPGVSDADRKAIEGVQDALQVWHRYSLAVRAEQADLIVVVHKAHGGGVDSPSGLPATQRAPIGQTPARSPGQPGDADSMGAAAQMGAEGDRLQIYTMTPDGKRKGPIWTRELQGGLDGPMVMLVTQLESAVERAYPAPRPAAATTP
jgi:hypothetical protein